MRMLSKVKMSLAAVVAASLFSSASYALEAGNVVFNPVNGTCQPSPLTGYPWGTEENYNVPILMGSVTAGGDTYYYLSMTTPQVIYTGGPQPAWTWIYILNTTTGTYSLVGPGASSATVSGSFTGSITEGLYGNWSINLKMNCGATIVGGAWSLGS